MCASAVLLVCGDVGDVPFVAGVDYAVYDVVAAEDERRHVVDLRVVVLVAHIVEIMLSPVDKPVARILQRGVLLEKPKGQCAVYSCRHYGIIQVHCRQCDVNGERGGILACERVAAVFVHLYGVLEIKGVFLSSNGRGNGVVAPLFSATGKKQE